MYIHMDWKRAYKMYYGKYAILVIKCTILYGVGKEDQ